MISEEYFLSKMKELSHMKLIPITPQVIKDVYPRFKDFETTDLDHAVDNLIFSEDRFDFTKLLKRMVHRRADRIESQGQGQKSEEAEAARRFFSPPRYSGECTRKECHGCQHIKDCKTRAHEWLKGINTILSRKRGPGEGKKMANDLIHFMNTEFIGVK